MTTKKTNELERNGREETNSLKLYMKEINRIPLMNREEEVKAARLAAKGNMVSRDKLVNSNLRFVISVAKKYQGKGLPLEDLISEGNMGLLSAAKHFDVEKGYRFITYAVWWIRQSIIKAINEKGRMIRLPTNKNSDLIKIDKSRQIFFNEGGRNMDSEIENIAQILDIPLKKAEMLLRLGHDVSSLDDPVMKYNDTMTLIDMVEDENAISPIEYVVNNSLKDELDNAIKGLKDRPADVIRCRFGLEHNGPLTLRETGVRHNLSRERIRQIELKALMQLKESPKQKVLESFIA